MNRNPLAAARRAVDYADAKTLKTFTPEFREDIKRRLAEVVTQGIPVGCSDQFLEKMLEHEGTSGWILADRMVELASSPHYRALFVMGDGTERWERSN